MKNQVWRWVLGLLYIFAVAIIWIGSSFVVQSVVDEGVSPFLVTYICNSLFVVYIPLVEIARFLDDKYGSLLVWRNRKLRQNPNAQESSGLEQAVLLDDNEIVAENSGIDQDSDAEQEKEAISGQFDSPENVVDIGTDEKGRWTRRRVGKVSLLICPFWFFAQLTFNLSLKYTTVTSNTILSSSSSLFTYLVALVFLGEKFTWVKLISVLLCMGGTVIVSLGDSRTESSSTAPNSTLGDFLALISSALYAIYITLIRIKLPDEDDEAQGRVSTAHFLGFLGLFNFLIFLPIALILEFKNSCFTSLTWNEFGLVIGKGLSDNVLSDYLWAKAVLLTTTTVATAGLSIQVPLAAIVDTLAGNAPNLLDYVGAGAVMIGFAGINIPSDAFYGNKVANAESESGCMDDSMVI